VLAIQLYSKLLLPLDDNRQPRKPLNLLRFLGLFALDLTRESRVDELGMESAKTQGFGVNVGRLVLHINLLFASLILLSNIEAAPRALLHFHIAVPQDYQMRTSPPHTFVP
jgi:hypothetical protein